MKRHLILCWIIWLACSVDIAGDLVDYVRDVKPILKTRCFKCHGPEKQESDLRLDTADFAISGGVSGPAIVTGKSTESLIIKVLEDTSDEVVRMPPENEGKRLSDEQIESIRRWIDQGALHPDNETAAIVEPIQSTHWSFQPIQRPHVPDTGDVKSVQNAIDRFVLSELMQRGIRSSPAAHPVTLVRRLSLDLRGLPPSIDEIDRFVDSGRVDAYDRLLDRLFASPRYGERWGRHWLDLAQYADSDGYTNDHPRVIWKYRDWVIDAINRDLPFDQFTIEQIAGDLIPDATQKDIIATGFYRNTQHNREGGSDGEQYRIESIVERISTTGIVFLGLTLGCARCHDHKFDPVSQSEFYELFAFLNNQDEPTLTIPLPGRDYESLKQLRAEVASYYRELKQYDAAAEAQQPEWERKFAAGAVKDKNESIVKILQISPDQRTNEQREKITTLFHQQDPQRIALVDQIAELRKREKKQEAKATTSTLVMREREKARETFVHIRGDFLRKGKRVSPRVPAILPSLTEAPANPNRLDLARWLVASDNPLTPRVIVNRDWQQFFGSGMVETENDFGTQGSLPTHPQLLDWLSTEFMEKGWHRKRLHRLIVTSATYRQSSLLNKDLVHLDPRNHWLARQNRLRLEAETIRDATLTAAGLLSDKMYGPSVYPPQPAGVEKMTRNPNRKWNVSTGEDRYRRGMYTFFWRSSPHPFLIVFDAPASNTTCTRRDRSNTPLQALTLLNDKAFFEAAEALALRVLREADLTDWNQQVAYIFRLCLGREPSIAEVRTVRELLDSELNGAPDNSDNPSFAAWTTVSRTLFNIDEFITRE